MFKNMSGLMQKAQQMQEKMANVQKEVEGMTFTGTAGDGAVKVDILGNNKVQAISVDDSLINVEEKDLMLDLITVSINQAIDAAKKCNDDKISEITKGVPMPGNMKLPL